MLMPTTSISMMKKIRPSARFVVVSASSALGDIIV
jgi:hypothetical protein